MKNLEWSANCLSPRPTALIITQLAFVPCIITAATPVGAAIALGPLSGLSEYGLGIMMAVAGGSFLYVAASDLIPETHEKDVLQNVFFLLVGAGFLYLLTILFE